MAGKVFLVGAGPGDPELLTVKGLRILQSADVVLHDELVGAEILSLAPSTAQVRNVGKRSGRKTMAQSEINDLMIHHALLGLRVVRLKGGDPMIFGRAGEEMAALQSAGICFEVVPGVTAALGAAAGANIPLTHRDISSALIVLTGRQSKEKSLDWPGQIPANATLLIYMPGYDYAAITLRLKHSGLGGATACAIISRATCEDEQMHRTTIDRLAGSPVLPSPTLLVVGEVVRLAQAQAELSELMTAPISITSPTFLSCLPQSEKLLVSQEISE